MANEDKFAVAPKGAAQIYEVVTLYRRSSGKDLEDQIPDLCTQIENIDIFVIKIALSIYKKQFYKTNKAAHPNYYINLCKSLSKKIKSNPLVKEPELKDFDLKLGRSI